MATATFRVAAVDDASGLASFARKLFVETYARFNDPDNFKRYLDSAFGDDIQREQLCDPDTLTVVAESCGNLAGYYQVIFNGTTPACIDARPVAELARFYIDPVFHGTGLAQRQIAHLFSQAAERADGIWLGVWQNNPRAIRFYEKAGMRNVGETSFLLGDDLQRDHVFFTKFDDR